MDETVNKALILWGMADATYTLAAKRENTVYRVTSKGADYALRLHRVGYRTQEELRSELQWMALLANANIRVPAPIPSESGALFHDVRGILVDILDWLPGIQVGAAGSLPDHCDRQSFCHDLGQAMAKLHTVSDNWARPNGFTRPKWDRAGLVGPAPLWGPFWENPMLSSKERDLLIAVQTAANTHLKSIESSLDYGLIHADLLSENMMLDGNKLYMIDFDDSGFGFRDFELATFLLRFLDAPDYNDLLVALCDGYAARRQVNHDHISLFLVLRALTYVGWIVPRMAEKNGRDKSNIAIRRAVKLGEKYLT